MSDSQREAFEQHIRREYGPSDYTTLVLQRNELGHYTTTWVANQWIGWMAALASVSAEPWQPIETAPRGANGYCWMNLAWGPDGDQSTGAGMRWGDRFFAAGVFYCIGAEKRYELREVEVKPTHWMPLPASPTAHQVSSES